MQKRKMKIDYIGLKKIILNLVISHSQLKMLVTQFMVYAADLEMSGEEEMTTTGNGIPYSKTNAMDQEKKLLEPLAYLLQVPGKNIRKKLLHAFNFWMKVDDAKVHEIGEIVQMLHNASLLVDDIEDNSILRRGIPVAHKVLNFSLILQITVSRYSSSKPP